MATLQKYNIKGEKVGEETVDDALITDQFNDKLIKECLTTYADNQRQWSANTKGRKEVSYSNKKPHKQKGTGGARQGYLGAPQYRGGGVVFGPKPKFKQNVTLNKKERQIALYQVLSRRIREGSVQLIEEPKMDKPSTSTVSKFLSTRELQGKNVLILAEERDNNFELSMRNIYNDPKRGKKKIDYKITENLNAHNVARADQIVLVDAIEALREILERGKSVSKKKEAN